MGGLGTIGSQALARCNDELSRDRGASQQKRNTDSDLPVAVSVETTRPYKHRLAGCTKARSTAPTALCRLTCRVSVEAHHTKER